MSGDFSHMSDADLLAYIHTNQADRGPAAPEPVPAAVAPPGPVATYPLPAPSGLTGRGTPLDARLPTANVTPPVSLPQQAQNVVNSATSGVPVIGAYLDEADSATDAALAPYVEPLLRHIPGHDRRFEIGDLPTFQQRYDAAHNLQRYSADRFHAEHPIADTGLKIGGGVAGTLAMLPALAAGTAAAGPEAGLLARALTGSAEGGAIGATDSYGRGEGAWNDPSRIHGAEAGGALGSAGGLVLPVAAQGAKIAYGATAGKLVDALRGTQVVQAPAESEAATLAAALRGEGTTAEAAAPGAAETSGAVPASGDRLSTEAALIAAQRAPLKVKASNLDDAYIRIARAVKRDEMTPQEAITATQEIGPLGVLADSGADTRKLLRAAMDRPGPGSTIAQGNLTPRQNGTFDPETGTWLTRPSSTRITDQAKTGMGLDGKDFHTEDAALISGRQAAADPAYAAMRAHPPVATAELADFTASPMFQSAYADARAIAAKTFVRAADGTEKIVPLPAKMPDTLDWRTLDLMKQGMDDMISTAPQQGIGASSRGASKGYLQRFVGKLDSLNPDYAVARDAFAGPSAMRDALQEGRGLLSEDAPTVASDIASRPESERQMLRLGAYQALQSKLGNANVTFDAASQAGLMKPNQLARFQALFPTPKAFADFYRTMQNEKAMFATNRAASGNSDTASKLLNVEEGSNPQLEGLARVGEGASSGNVMALIRGIHQFGQEAPMSEDTAATIASVLSRHFGTEELPGVLAKMEAAQRAAAMADVIRQSSGTVAGEAASRTVQRGQ